MPNRADAAHVKAVNDWVDAVYVLSVKGFDARQTHIAREMARNDIAFSYVFAHDADTLDAELVAATFGPSDMKAAHQSLVLKNVWVWRDAEAKGYRRVLVFEDDAVLAPDFVARFDEAMRAATQLAPGWLVYLGGLDTKVPASYFRAPGPLVELPIATAEGCVHDALAMQRRLQWLSGNKATLAADLLIRHVDAQQGTHQFWLRHPVVEQGSVLGIFDSLLDGSRQKHSHFYNILRYRWNKFQRRWLRERLASFRTDAR